MKMLILTMQKSSRKSAIGTTLKTTTRKELAIALEWVEPKFWN